MDRNEILEKSQKDNKGRDERDLYIDLKASRAARGAIIWSIFLLYAALLVKNHGHIDRWFFLLLPLSADRAGEAIVLWRNYRRRIYLLNFLLGLAAFVLCFYLCVFGPIR